MRFCRSAFTVLLLAFAVPATSATFTVDTTSDGSLQGCTAAPADCSLRGAILRSNTAGGADLIAFAIPAADPGCDAAGVCRIAVASSMDALIDAVTVDGYTQPGATPNTLTPAQGGSNAVLKIHLDGAACGTCSSALRMGDGATVRGLVINGFAQTSALSTGDFFFSAAGSNTRVEGNFIGTDVTGTLAVPNREGVVVQGGPNRSIGVVIGGSTPAARNVISGNLAAGVGNAGNSVVIRGNLIGTNATGTAAVPNGTNGIEVGACGFGSGTTSEIGGPAMVDRNVISGNVQNGIQVGSPNGGCGPATGHRIRGNFIGTDVTGTTAIPNGIGAPGSFNGFNVLFRTEGASGSPNVLGGILPGEGNVIAFAGAGSAQPGTGRDGVGMAPVNFVSVRGNAMFANAGLGIDTNADGRDPNDANDADDAASSGFSGRKQNFPEILQFLPGVGSAAITYVVDSAVANATYPIAVDFYLAAGDEGAVYLGSDTYAAIDAQAAKAITLTLPAGVTLASDAVVVATAADAELNQSEFSFTASSMTLAAPLASTCTALDSVYCDGFETGAAAALIVSVTVTAASGPFAPNGAVQIASDRGGSCTATLKPATSPRTSNASCLLPGAAAGPITITATLDALQSAFASPGGGDVVASGNFVLE